MKQPKFKGTQDYDIRAILKAIEDAYGIESGELDRFVNDDPPQLVEWELTISGYDNLSQSDKDLARGIIAEAIEVFNDFEGRFSITKDEDEYNE